MPAACRRHVEGKWALCGDYVKTAAQPSTRAKGLAASMAGRRSVTHTPGGWLASVIVNRHPIVSTNRHPKVSTRSDGFRLISPLFEPERIVTRFQNFTVMGKPVQQGRRHLGITEHSDPFAKR